MLLLIIIIIIVVIFFILRIIHEIFKNELRFLLVKNKRTQRLHGRHVWNPILPQQI